MAKKGKSRTRQGLCGLTMAQAHYQRIKAGDDFTAQEILDARRFTKNQMTYVGNEMFRTPMTRNQRRIAKELGISLEEV